MKKVRINKIFTYVAAIAISLSSMAMFYKIISAGFFQKGSGDFYIFLNHAHLYIEKGFLYHRDISLYGPGEPIYKFPPIYASTLVSSLLSGIEEPDLYLHAWALQAVSFLGGILLCLYATTSKPHRAITPIIIACILAFSASNNFFLENARRLQLEPYVFLLLSAALFLITKARSFWAGMLIGLTATLKVYPAFLMLFIIASREKRHLAIGFFSGIAISLLISLETINSEEHIFFIKNILPVLLEEPVYASIENISIANITMHWFPQIDSKSLNRLAFIIAILLWTFPILLNLIRKKKAHLDSTAAIDFSALFMVMLVGMPNFWWNYQILNLLPSIIAVKIISEKPTAHLLPLTALLSCFTLQTTVTAAPLFHPGLYNALMSLGEAPYITLRGSIQISLLIAILSLQWQVHQPFSKTRSFA